MAKYIDEKGLSHLWSRIKSLLNGKQDTDFSTLNEAVELLDSDVFIIQRVDGKTYKISVSTMKKYLDGESSTPSEDTTSAVVGVGVVGSMIIE